MSEFRNSKRPKLITIIIWITIIISRLHNKNKNLNMSDGTTIKSETGGINPVKSEGSTTSTLSTLTTSGSSSSRRSRPNKWQNKTNMPSSVETFKGSNAALRGKVFTVGPDQAYRYDDTHKALLVYIAERFDHRVYTSMKNKDKNIGMKLLTKPSAPTKEDPQDTTRTVLDKECEEFIEYQIEIKKYVDRKNKLDDDIQ